MSRKYMVFVMRGFAARKEETDSSTRCICEAASQERWRAATGGVCEAFTAVACFTAKFFVRWILSLEDVRSRKVLKLLRCNKHHLSCVNSIFFVHASVEPHATRPDISLMLNHLVSMWLPVNDLSIPKHHSSTSP